MKHASGRRFDMNKIPQNEPCFVIRGQDKLGPMILRQYAETYKMQEGYSKLIYSTIIAQAQNMESWQLEKGICKIAD